jgi:hypothetical protein
MPTADRRVGLSPPQFGLRTLLLAVTAVALLLVALKWWGPAIAAAILFLGISIAAHVLGNSLGTELRKQHGGHDPPPASAVPRGTSPGDEHRAETTTLGERRSLGLLHLTCSLLGLVAGAIGGGWWTSFHYGAKAGWGNLVIAVIAFGILGGIWTFLTLAFLQVTVGAAWHAIRGGGLRNELPKDGPSMASSAETPPRNA